MKVYAEDEEVPFERWINPSRGNKKSKMPIAGSGNDARGEAPGATHAAGGGGDLLSVPRSRCMKPEV